MSTFFISSPVHLLWGASKIVCPRWTLQEACARMGQDWSHRPPPSAGRCGCVLASRTAELCGDADILVAKVEGFRCQMR